MIEHSEFPWGPQYEPGMLTPMGLLGWLVAAALLAILLYRSRGEGGGGRKKLGDAIEWKYRAVARAARHAARADQDEVLKAHKILRDVIERTFGNLERAGGGLAAQLKLLDKARSGERDDQHGHGDDHHDHHDDHHRDDEDGPRPETFGAVAETVNGPNVTMNFGLLAEAPPKTAKPHKPKPKPTPPPTLKEQLQQLQEALQAFNAWWSRESERVGDLRAAREALNGPARTPDDLEKLIEGLK